MTRMPRVSSFIRLLALFLATGCHDVEVSPDAGIEPDLELGTGITTFLPIEDDHAFILERGPQGAQHIYVSLRTFGIDPRRARLKLELHRDRDGALVSTLDVVVTLRPVPNEDYAELAGLTLVVDEPDDALDEPLTLRATLTEAEESGGAVLYRERPIRIRW